MSTVPRKAVKLTHSLLELLKATTKIVWQVSLIKLEADISICICLRENIIIWFYKDYQPG